MALLDEDLTGEAFMSPRIRASMSAIGLWKFIVGIVLTAMFAIGSMFMVYLLYDVATSRYFRLYEFGSSVVALLLTLLGVYGGVLLTQAGSGFRKYIREKDQKVLEVSFDKQKIFWTIIGVISVLYALGMAFLMVVLLKEFLD